MRDVSGRHRIKEHLRSYPSRPTSSTSLTADCTNVDRHLGCTIPAKFYPQINLGMIWDCMETIILTGEKDHPPMESSTFKLLKMALTVGLLTKSLLTDSVSS